MYGVFLSQIAKKRARMRSLREMRETIMMGLCLVAGWFETSERQREIKVNEWNICIKYAQQQECANAWNFG